MQLQHEGEQQQHDPLRLSLVAAAASSFRGQGFGGGGGPSGYPQGRPGEPLSFPTPEGSHPEILPQVSDVPAPGLTIHFPTPEESPAGDEISAGGGEGNSAGEPQLGDG